MFLARSVAMLDSWPVPLNLYLHFKSFLQPCLVMEGDVGFWHVEGNKGAETGAEQHKVPQNRWVWSLTNDMSCRRSAWTQQAHHPQLCPAAGCTGCRHGKLSQEDSEYHPAPGCTAYNFQSAQAHLRAGLRHEAVIWWAVQEY